MIDSPGVVVVVEEAGGAVETERGGWEVGGTTKDGEEGEGVAAVKKRQVVPIRAHTDYHLLLTVEGADSCPWNGIFSHISIFFWVF